MNHKIIMFHMPQKKNKSSRCTHTFDKKKSLPEVCAPIRTPLPPTQRHKVFLSKELKNFPSQTWK